MSADQFSEKPLPPDKKRCPHCGAEISADETRCWMCQESFSIQEGPPKPDHRPRPDATRSGDSWVVWILLEAVILVSCLIFTVGVPGVVIFAIIVAVPFFAWLAFSQWPVKMARDHREPSNLPASLLSGAGVAFLIALAMFIAFFVICVHHFANESWR